jgi:hypothetical protein
VVHPAMYCHVSLASCVSAAQGELLAREAPAHSVRAAAGNSVYMLVLKLVGVGVNLRRAPEPASASLVSVIVRYGKLSRKKN